MKVGDICMVRDTPRASQHPAGSKVKVILIAPSGYEDNRTYYCQTTEGKTCYWYAPEDLEVVESEDLK